MEKSLDWGLITIVVIGVLGVLVAFGAIRKWAVRIRAIGEKERDIIPFSRQKLYFANKHKYFFRSMFPIPHL